MNYYIIPLEQVPNQTIFIELDGKTCEIHIYLKYKYMYMDLKIDNNVIFNGLICLNRVKINQYPIRELSGDFMFIDSQGNKDPYYNELNERWYFSYVKQ